MKATTQWLSVLSLVGLMVGCATIYDVSYDYDKQVDFAGLQRFEWLPVPEAAGMDGLVVDQIVETVNATLQSKGLTRTSDNPDFLIAQHLGKADKVQVTNWGYGYGPYGGYWGGFYGPGGGVSTYEYEEGTLILDFVDATSKKLIWRGSAKAEIENVDTPKKREKIVNEAVQEILKKFPPPSS